jgi:ABC-type transport system involved in cytochrome bd biosynthesis fused ATPase/permease subunit
MPVLPSSSSVLCSVHQASKRERPPFAAPTQVPDNAPLRALRHAPALAATAAPPPVLRVDALSVEFATTDRVVAAVRNLSLCIGRGETLAVVGESGSG